MTEKFISYDLGVPETSQSYKALIADIYTLSNRVLRLTESFWMVIDCPLSCEMIKAKLSKHLDGNDKMVVFGCKLTEWADQRVTTNK